MELDSRQHVKRRYITLTDISDLFTDQSLTIYQPLANELRRLVVHGKPFCGEDWGNRHNTKRLTHIEVEHTLS